MDNRCIMVRLIALAIAIMCIILPLASAITIDDNSNGIIVVVTVPYILGDIEKMLCVNDVIRSVTPLGVEIHEYQLTYNDIEILSKANLVISTGHAPFEVKIKELVKTGELSIELIEIPSIPNIVSLKIPSTGVNNFHGILFHRENYIIFIEYMTNILSKLRPECSSIYIDNAKNLIDKAEKIFSIKPLNGTKVVIDTPVLQYVAVALGASVEAILMTEHDVPVQPQDLFNVEEVLEKYKENLTIIVSEGSPAYDLLNSLASKYGVSLVIVPNPEASTNSILRYIEDIQNIIRTPPVSTSSSKSIDVNVLIIIVVILTITLLTILMRLRK